MSLVNEFARTAHGYPRHEVINAGGNMVINALRQSHSRIEGAEAELDDLVERMKVALRERHYDEHGRKKVHAITLPSLEELLRG